tara:strand:+ start:1135 stop:1395 length:261 start_codon:yes stop_codon:yes gene_type:complete
MKTLSFTKLMALKPFKLDTFTNQCGQIVDIYEHPTQGDMHTVLGVIESEKIAFDTDFFDTNDFYENSDYNPIFKDGKVKPAFEFDL